MRRLETHTEFLWNNIVDEGYFLDRKGEDALEKYGLKRSMLRAGSGYNWLRIVCIDTP
jgi:hypothetical protein